MEWLGDPTAWLGLGTLVLLEVVLGVDNLIFIAILTERLPETQRARARLIGLSLAMIMRLSLLAGISWLQSLTAPLFSAFGSDYSVRDLILIGGGLFLLFKGTTELHGRIEGVPHEARSSARPVQFWQVIVQIVLLDIVFSLDSVITAIGMVNDLPLMMIAVIVAVIAMMVASGPLMSFVTAHVTVVILCLSFLLMIGFSLVLDGFGVHIPKGYLYAAIAFSVAVEALNQLAQRNLARTAASDDLRARAADAILRILGGDKPTKPVAEDLAPLVALRNTSDVFAPEERKMVESVLSLGDRTVRSLMTDAAEVVWLDVDDNRETLRAKVLRTGHAAYPVCRGSLQQLVGVARATDIVHDLVRAGRIDKANIDRRPMRLRDDVSVLDAISRLRSADTPLAIIVDHAETIEGVLTINDLLSAIVGDASDTDLSSRSA